MEILEQFKEYLIENYDTEGEQNTIKAYLSDVKQFLMFFKEYFGEDIVDFSRAHIIEFKNEINGKRNLKFSTINRKIAAISIYENFLVDRGIRKENVKMIKKSDFYKLEKPIITSDMLPKKTIKKVRLKAGEKSKREYAMFVLLNDGGLRVSELINLQLERDIDFEMYSIHVLGKGKKVRNIFMKDNIYEAIIEYLPEREKILNGKKNKYLFVSNKTANTNKKMCRTSINNLLEKYCKDVGENKINPHIFRHDCATSMYEEGCSDLMIKKWLGHSSNATDTYTHPGGENFKNSKKNDNI